MIDFFNNYSSFVVFLHVISAVIWVGGMIAIRFAVHYSMQNIEEPKIKLGRTIENLKRFFSMVIPSIIVLLITAIIMILALGFKGTDLYKFIKSEQQHMNLFLDSFDKYVDVKNIFHTFNIR